MVAEPGWCGVCGLPVPGGERFCRWPFGGRAGDGQPDQGRTGQAEHLTGGSTGRVLVIESHAAGGDPAAFAEMNLRMLVLAGGRERTIDHYHTLAAAAGLQVTAVHDITERHMIIECVPA